MRTLLFTVPALAKHFSNSSFIIFLVVLLKLWYFAITRKLLGLKGDFVVSGYFNKKKITFFLRHSMDFAVLKEIYIEKEYEWFPIKKPKVIIDMGAHFGDTALYYNAMFPDAKIIAIEPSPENYGRLVKHTKNNENIIPVQVAVSDETGSIGLNILKSSLSHSITNRDTAFETVQVDQISLKGLFEKYELDKVDMIKFDIEGAEFSLFKNINPEDYSRSYIGELHFDLTQGDDVDSFTAIFSNLSTEVTPLGKERYILKACEEMT